MSGKAFTERLLSMLEQSAEGVDFSFRIHTKPAYSSQSLTGVNIENWRKQVQIDAQTQAWNFVSVRN